MRGRVLVCNRSPDGLDLAPEDHEVQRRCYVFSWQVLVAVLY
jgi:hypothetical protein